MVGADDKWDVFISYATPDVAEASDLWARLTERGLRCFIDRECLDVGDRWPQKLKDELERSTSVAVVVSANSDAAFYQGEEIALAIGVARSLGRRVMPIYLGDDVPPPLGLITLHALRKSDGWTHVIDRIARVFTDSDAHRASSGLRVWCRRIPRLRGVVADRDALLDTLDASTGATVLHQVASS